MRRKIVAGNWKMNNDRLATEKLLSDLRDLTTKNHTRILVAPTAVHLAQSVTQLKDSPITVAAQNMHAATAGAYTGEIAANMLKSVGVHTVILGHSERRTFFNETNTLLAEKVASALKQDMETIFCFGEQLDERKQGNHIKIVERQLTEALFNQESIDWEKIILAYEPVWAIGTGESATPEQAQEMHRFIRSLLKRKYGDLIALNTSILYGGSVKPNNAKEIFSNENIDQQISRSNIFNKIRSWAMVRGIYDKGNSHTQYVKLMEEAGELGRAVLKNDNEEFVDAIGDMVVVLTNMAHLGGTTIEECIDTAYNVIAKRTGKMVNGTFVKDEK